MRHRQNLVRVAMKMPVRSAVVLAILLNGQVRSAATTQNTNATPQEAYVGDAPADPGPLAKDISGALNQRAIRHIVRKVADWQLSRAEGHFDQDWTYAALYRGLIAAARATGDRKYEDAVREAS